MNKHPEGAGGTAMIEIFGGIFALMLVLFLIINILSQGSIEERLETSKDEGLYRVGWESHGAGFVVMTFSDELRILETQESVKREDICNPSSPFVKYAYKIYNSSNNQIIFTILERSVPTMAVARNCMMELFPGKVLNIGWIIANNELLKSISLDDLPPYIENTIQP